MTNEPTESFDSVKNRLNEIVEAVGNEDISLDDALGLYEEAVKLGMKASTLLEEGVIGAEYRVGDTVQEYEDFSSETIDTVTDIVSNEHEIEEAESEDFNTQNAAVTQQQ